MPLSHRFVTYCIVLAMAAAAHAGGNERACGRPRVGAEVAAPSELRAQNGVLRASISFRTSVDIYGSRLYCYLFDGAGEAPVLRVSPGDELILTLHNELPPDVPDSGVHAHAMEIVGPCGRGKLSAASTNLHFHGMHVPPVCHQDDVLSTIVQPASGGYEYRIRIPQSQPPGLYWYHPHPHGFSEMQVLGGASGPLIVEGMASMAPRVAGVPERVLVLRDQLIPGVPDELDDAEQGKDFSLNFVPVMFPLYQPAALKVRPFHREFWRVLNASADTYFNIQIRFGPVIQEVLQPQPVDLVAIDGVALTPGAISGRTSILIPPGGRAEFIAPTPPPGFMGQLVTLTYNAGPDGAAAPQRAIANIVGSADAPEMRSVEAGKVTAAPAIGLESFRPAAQRKLYFSEVHTVPGDRTKDSYFITVEGAKPKEFDMNYKRPDIVAVQGTVEDWFIENRANEAHAFHIHQLHFQVLERDGKPVSETEIRDTVDLPFWDGKSAYPSIKLRMDFRSPEIVGTFLYHCHILEHEDRGMMGAIQVIRQRKGR